MKTYSMILKGVDLLDLPTKRMSKNSVNFMRKCCKLNPLERLGYQKNGITDIKKNKWFENFDWNGLQNCTLHSPFKIKASSPPYSHTSTIKVKCSVSGQERFRQQ